MTKEIDSCVKPAGGPLNVKQTPAGELSPPKEKDEMVTARVGKEAPDFEASAYVAKEGFKNITLSDYKKQWVVLCFYPGDFTFV